MALQQPGNSSESSGRVSGPKPEALLPQGRGERSQGASCCCSADGFLGFSMISFPSCSGRNNCVPQNTFGVVAVVLTSGVQRHLEVNVDEEADAVPRDDGVVHGVEELLAPRLLLGLAAIVHVTFEVPW